MLNIFVDLLQSFLHLKYVAIFCMVCPSLYMHILFLTLYLPFILKLPMFMLIPHCTHVDNIFYLHNHSSYDTSVIIFHVSECA